MAWTIEVAKASRILSRIILSTDSEEIAEIGTASGAEVPFLRPRELALDTTPTAAVVGHAVTWLRDHDGALPQFVVVLEPTSPTRRAFHIREAVTLLQQSHADSVASVSVLPHHYVPSKVLTLHPDHTITGVDGTPVASMVHRRQDLPVSYAFDGLLFACRTAVVLANPPTLFGDTVMGYVVDPRYRTDLDDESDWEVAEARLRRLLAEEGGKSPAVLTPAGGAP